MYTVGGQKNPRPPMHNPLHNMQNQPAAEYESGKTMNQQPRWLIIERGTYILLELETVPASYVTSSYNNVGTKVKVVVLLVRGEGEN